MARPRSLERQLDDLANKFEPRIRAAFKTAIRDVQSTILMTEIIEAIKFGDLERAFRATGLSAAAMRPITSMIEQAYEAGGVTVANSFPKAVGAARGVFRFDVRNSRSERWLREHSSTLVTRISDDTRTGIREIIEAGVRDGRNPRSIALDIAGRVDPITGRRTGGIVGLTGPQAKFVSNARAELNTLDPAYFSRVQRDKRFDSIVRKAIASKTPLSTAKVDALVNKYSDNLLLLRGETIARTEALQSLNQAADAAFRQAMDEGTLNKNNVTKTWDSTGDDGRTRATHLAMEGQKVKMDEPFKTPGGSHMMFPGDSSMGAPASEIINCRCRVKYKVDWLADLEDDEPPAPQPAPAPAPSPIPPPVPPVVQPPIPRLPDPEPAPEPIGERNARLEREQREYVLTNGRTTGTEFLSNYDMETGEILGRTDGSKNFVGFPPNLVAAISDPARKISLHHNHPSSSSFSGQDLFMLNEYEGMKEIWAYGHNGSSYLAKRTGPAMQTLADKMKLRREHEAVAKEIVEKLKKNAPPDADQQTEKDINLVFWHLVSEVMRRRGYIEYEYELKGETLEAANRITNLVYKVMKDYPK